MTDGAARIELLDRPSNLERLEGLFLSIWQPNDGQSPIDAQLMRALGHAGNYVAGAYDGGDLIGGCVAFFGSPGDRSLHSHIAAVAPQWQGRHVGLALKLHQREWAAAHDADQITWTFDPLVRRNAYFNLARLGAAPTAYLPDFYGDMDDAINAGQGSDRLFVSWPVGETETSARALTEPPDADLVLEADPDGAPVHLDGSAHAARALVRVPADIDELRRAAPHLARAWREAVREVLGAHLDAGARITGFTRSGCYVLDRTGS